MAPFICKKLFFLLALLLPIASCADPINLYCGAKNYTTASELLQLEEKLNRVLPDLITRTPIDGFAISSFGGVGKDTLYGLTYCRGDLTFAACSACIAEASRKLPTACPGLADARIWYDHCFLRYGTDEFLGTLDTGKGASILVNAENATHPMEFHGVVEELMEKVWKAAAAPGKRRFAWALKMFDAGNVTIRGMAQCTRDLPISACRQCLVSALGLFSSYCRFRQGCHVLYSSCVMRYEIYDFLFIHSASYIGQDKVSTTFKTTIN